MTSQAVIARPMSFKPTENPDMAPRNNCSARRHVRRQLGVACMITPHLGWTRLSEVSSDMEFDWRSLVCIEAQSSEAVARELLIGRGYVR
jgi:hypothetical protein